MMSAYDIIKAARSVSAELGPAPTLAAQSLDDYRKITRKLVRDGQMNVEATLLEAGKTRSPRTWYTRQAALKWGARKAITQLLTDQDRLQRQMKSAPDDVGLEKEWLKLVRWLDFYTRLVQLMPSTCPIPKAERKRRHSKRQDLGGLPDDWRERLLGRMQKYALPFLVAAITGCRPAELTTEVLLSIDDGELIVCIQGAKVSKNSGQRWRELRWTLPREGLVGLMAEKVVKAGNELRVSLDSPKNFSTAVRNAAQREWPRREKTVTPYCLRHVFAADVKASCLPGELIAAALGQAVNTTAQYYGSANQKGNTSVCPDKVAAERTVRMRDKRAIPQRQAKVAKRFA